MLSAVQVPYDGQHNFCNACMESINRDFASLHIEEKALAFIIKWIVP
jgi:hypothetical protein